MSEAISQLASAVTGAKQGAQSAAADSSQPRNKKLDQLAENTVDLGGRNKVITTNTGAAVSNNTSWLKAGERGPLLLEDFHAREK